jgi:hypothetical protein
MGGARKKGTGNSEKLGFRRQGSGYRNYLGVRISMVGQFLNPAS